MFLNLLIMFLAFIFSLVCIFKPVQVAWIMCRWTIWASRNSGIDAGVDLQKRIFLLENDPNEYKKIFNSELLLIKQSGLMAVLILVIGFFIGLVGK